MATSSLKSAVITNRDATPRVLSNANIADGNLRSNVGFITAGAADDTASRYRVVELPSNCILRSIYISSVAQGGASAVNVGAYRNTADGGAVVSAAFFASAFSLVSAVSRSDVTNQSASYTAQKREQPLWQALGMTSDPRSTLDIVVAPSTALTNGGQIGVEVQYVI